LPESRISEEEKDQQVWLSSPPEADLISTPPESFLELDAHRALDLEGASGEVFAGCACRRTPTYALREKLVADDDLELETHAIPIGNVEQPRDAPDQVLFVLVDAPVRVTDAPEHLDDRKLIFFRELAIEPVSELVQ